MDRWGPVGSAAAVGSGGAGGAGGGGGGGGSTRELLLRAFVSILAGTAVTVISAIAMKLLVVDDFVERMAGASGGPEGGEPAPHGQPAHAGAGAGGAPSAASERIAQLRLSQHERALLPDLVWPEDVDAGVEDVGGLDAQLRELREQVLYPLSHPHLFAHSAVAQRPTGMLLHGPPGTGKTLLAKAIAKSTCAAFLNVNVARLQSKWFGETPKLVTALFSLARKLAPCVLFVDEIDGLLGTRREGSGGQGADATATTVFLQCWEGLRTSATAGDNGGWVLVIGATNRPDALDPAVMRRMPRRVRVGMPDARARADILRVLVRRERVDPAGLDLVLVARRAEGFSGSDLREVVREAAMGPIRDLISAAEGAGAGAGGGGGGKPGLGAVASAAAEARCLTTADLLAALARVPPSGQRVDADEDEAGGRAGLSAAREMFALRPELQALTEGCDECSASLAHLALHLGGGFGRRRGAGVGSATDNS